MAEGEKDRLTAHQLNPCTARLWRQTFRSRRDATAAGSALTQQPRDIDAALTADFDKFLDMSWRLTGICQDLNDNVELLCHGFSDAY